VCCIIESGVNRGQESFGTVVSIISVEVAGKAEIGKGAAQGSAGFDGAQISRQQLITSATCTALLSTSLWTATDLMPSLRQVLITRMAISPRLAMRILSK